MNKDPAERIASALERIASAMERMEAAPDPVQQVADQWGDWWSLLQGFNPLAPRRTQ